MLNDKIVDAHIEGINFNKHNMSHLYRAAQEGVAFAFRYGFDIMSDSGLKPSVIRAGQANMFLSDVFTETFVNTTGVAVELYKTEGSSGAAIGSGKFNFNDASTNLTAIKRVEVTNASVYNEPYQNWKEKLNDQLKS